MTTPAQTPPWYGKANDWSEVISGAGKGASSAMQGSATLKEQKMAAKEHKRRTLANLLNAALKRKQRQSFASNDYVNEMSGNQSDVLQNLAKTFSESNRR